MPSPPLAAGAFACAGFVLLAFYIYVLHRRSSQRRADRVIMPPTSCNSWILLPVKLKPCLPQPVVVMQINTSSSTSSHASSSPSAHRKPSLPSPPHQNMTTVKTPTIPLLPQHLYRRPIPEALSGRMLVREGFSGTWNSCCGGTCLTQASPTRSLRCCSTFLAISIAANFGTYVKRSLRQLKIRRQHTHLLVLSSYMLQFTKERI